MGVQNGKVFRNASWIIACRIVQALLSFVIGMVSARYLGPSDYGLINYASSVIAFVVPLAQLGLRNVLVEEIVSHPEREGATVGTALVMSSLSGMLCMIGSLAFVSIVNVGETDTLIVCALYSVSLLFQMLEMVQYWYQAKLLSKYTSITSLVAYVLVSLYRVFLLVTQKSIYWFAVSSALDHMIIAAVLMVIYRRTGTQRLSVSASLGKALLARSRYYIVSGLMVTIFTQTDKIMIKTMLGDSVNGYYSAAVTCAATTEFIFSALVDSMRPVIFESKRTGNGFFEKNMSRLYSLVLYMGLAQSAVLTLLADPVIRILYGADYLPAIPLLRIITWYTAFSFMGSVRNIWMLAEEKQRYLWIINLSGAVLNVAGNLALIPVMGASGAALSSVATQFFANFVLCLIVKPIRPTVRLIWKAMNPGIILEMIPRRKAK